jgi:hypothetical protein
MPLFLSGLCVGAHIAANCPRPRRIPADFSIILQLEACFAARDRDQAEQVVRDEGQKRRKVSLLSFQGSDGKGRASVPRPLTCMRPGSASTIAPVSEMTMRA